MSNTLTASELNKADLKCKSIGQLTVNGSVININNLQIQNIGNVSSSATKVGYYLSVNTIISENDYFIGFDDQIALSPNASSTQFFTADVNSFPAIPAGTYYVGVIIDYTGNVAEEDEENNSCYYSYPQVTVNGNNAQADLTCDDRGTLNITGTTVTVNNLKVKNVGAGRAEQSYVGYYLSTDQTFTTDDIKIGSKLISPLNQWSGVTVNFNVDISYLNLPNGTYYVGIILDFDNRVDETNESNNNDCFFYSPTITINNGNGGGSHKPDLRCANTGYLYKTSTSFSITNLTIENIGNATAGASTVGYYLSTDTNISTGDYLVGTDYVASLGTTSGSNRSTESITVNYSDLSAIPPGTYFVGILIDKNQAVLESNESNNTCFFNSPKIVIDNQYDNSDLTCGQLGYLAVNNNILSLSNFKVRNIGNASANPTRVGYYLSQDSNISTNDIFLGDDYVEGLPAGAWSAGEDFTFNISSLNLNSRTYFFGVVVDYENAETEVDESNNTCFFTSPKITVQQAPSKPDLTCASRGTLWVENNSVTIYDLVIKNQGESTAGASKVGVYLSTDTDFSTEDFLIGTIDINALSPHATQTVSFGANYNNFNVPNGTYFVGIIVDKTNVVTESNEYNNNSCFWTSPKVTINNTSTVYKPDLTCGQSASIYVNGTQINISNLQIKNIGNISSGSPTKIKYYLSTNTSFSTSDFQIGSDDIHVLAPGQSSIESLYVNVGNLNIPSGTYYIGVIIDPEHVVTESNENNNTCYFANTQITINNTPQYADLTCDNPGYLAVTGTNVSLQNVKVKNIGHVAAGASYVGFYLSTDQTITRSDYRIGSRYISGLGSWQSTTFDFSVDVGTLSGIPAGTYYVGVIVDDTRLVTETNEGNNVCSYSNPQVVIGGGNGYHGDLTCDDNGTLTINGSNINIHGFRVKNIGNQQTNRFTYVGYFLSLDQNFNASSDILIGTDYISTLNPWQSVTHSFYKDISSLNISPGNYYVGMIIDYQNVVFESNENNNTCYFNNQTITVGGTGGGYQADLTCHYSGTLNVTSSTISVSGTTIKNVGNINVNNSRVGFYLSSDQTFTTDDFLIGSASTGSLPASSSVVVNFSKSINGITVPNGNYYLGIIIDDEGVINESNESNNNDCSFANVITIGNNGGGNGHLPNLVCEYPGVLTINGSKISIQNLRVKNIGNGVAGESRVGFYLSSDATISRTTDTRFTSTYVGSLDPWEFSRETIVNVDISGLNLPDGEYFIGAYVDYQLAVGETNESDNTCFFSTQKITIGGGNNGQADLVCNSSGTLNTSGSIITVNNFVVKNEGSGTAAPSLLSYYLSSDQAITINDILLGSGNIPELVGGASSTVSQSFNLNDFTISDGTYYVGMIIDRSNVVNESNEVNNNDCAFTNQPITINNGNTGGGGGSNLADLKCDNVGTYTISGNTILINGTRVKNIGDRTALTHVIGYYLSPDPIINPNASNSNDINIKLINGTALSSGGSQTYNTSIDLTNNNSIPSGVYYIGVFIDVNNSISETTESNNSCSFNNTITINNTGGGGNGGNRCTDFQTLACGESLPYQSTTSSTNDFDIWDYSNCLNSNGNSYNAGDELYKIVNVPANTTLTITLRNLSTDLDMLVFRSCGSSNSCIAKSVTTGTTSEQIVINNASGNYFVVVDGKTPYGEGTFTIEASCSTNGDGGNDDNGNGGGNGSNRCNDFTSIDCGDSVTGSTASSSSDFNLLDYNCQTSGDGYNGNDKLYKVTVTTSSTLNISLSNLSANLDVLVLTDCPSYVNANFCVGASTNSSTTSEQVTIPNALGTYLIIVDAPKSNVTSSFRLSVNCTSGGAGAGNAVCACEDNDYFQDSFCDDLNSYNSGPLGPQSSCWTTSGGVEGSSIDGRIVVDQSDNCLEIDGNMNSNQNTILKLGNRATGTHETSFKIKVPTGSRSTVQLVQEIGTGGNRLGGKVIFVGDGTGLLNVNGQYYEFTHPDNWFDMTMTASLENNLMYFLINGNRKFVWQLSYASADRNGLQQLGGYRFSVENGNSKLLVDDVEFNPLGGASNNLSDATTGNIENISPVPFIEAHQLVNAPQLAAFPNPTRGKFTAEVSLAEATDYRLDVLNITGEVIQSFTSKDASFMEYDFDLGKESNGVYYLRLQTDKEVVTKQVVLLK